MNKAAGMKNVKNQSSHKTALGILIVLASALMFGSTGVAGEYLINQRGLSSAWLTTYRTTFAGVIMVVILGIRQKREMFRVWRNPKDAVRMVLFGLFGIGLNLYCYMLAVQYTNAPTATTLQYLSPAIIVVYLSVRSGTLPSSREIIAVICALAGVLSITTHGSFHTLAITPLGLMVGLTSAFFMIFYNLFPRYLLRKYGSLYTFAWGQFVAGILMNLIRCPVWRFTPPSNGVIDLPLILVLLYQLTFGTMVSYCIYLYGITLIGPARASMIASVEPVATAVLAALLLSTPLVFMDYVGIVLISVCILLLSIPSEDHGDRNRG